MNLKIILTGGGTAGHVVPNLALIEDLKLMGWQVEYIGSKDGIEKGLVQDSHVPFYPVHSGKLRRYFSWKNFTDLFRIFWGIVQSYRLLNQLKPDIVFSKGGFVAFPVVVGAWLNRIPVVAHESDMTPGLANRLSFPFVDKICVNFATAQKYFKQQERVIVTGTPIRQALLKGNKEKGLAYCGFNSEKPCLLIIGGSQGASALNTCIRQSLPILCQKFQVIHLCGKGKIDTEYLNRKDYCQFEYVKEELADLFAASDIVISRAGANTLCEILALTKRHILIPLPQQVSRGDQVHNARYFQQQGISIVIEEETLSPKTLLSALSEVDSHADEIIKKMRSLQLESATMKIIDVLKTVVSCCKQSCLSKR